MRTGLALALLLAGCASQEADTVLRQLPGQSDTAVIGCLGVPSREKELPDDHKEWTWDYTDTGAATTLPVSDIVTEIPLAVLSPITGSIGISGASSCHVNLLLDHDKVVQASFSGASGGLSGPNAACKPIIRGCRKP